MKRGICELWQPLPLNLTLLHVFCKWLKMNGIDRPKLLDDVGERHEVDTASSRGVNSQPSAGFLILEADHLGVGVPGRKAKLLTPVP